VPAPHLSFQLVLRRELTQGKGDRRECGRVVIVPYMGSEKAPSPESSLEHRTKEAMVQVSSISDREQHVQRPWGSCIQ
jgi:hypothetical protein